VDWQKTHLERGTASDDHERPCLALHATHVLIAEVLSVVIYSQHLFIRLIERHANRVTRCKHSTNPHTRATGTDNAPRQSFSLPCVAGCWPRLSANRRSCRRLLRLFESANRHAWVASHH
jgi:hypothetical protein